MSNRINKVNQLLLEELAKLIREELGEKLVTVLAVDTSADLKNAKVWISVFGQNEEEILKELEDKTVFFQSFLGKKLFIKNIPKLSFFVDKSSQRIAKIEQLLKK